MPSGIFFTAIFGLISCLIYSITRRLLPIMIRHWLGDVIGFIRYFPAI